jgi:excisionase family DNA binding protein
MRQTLYTVEQVAERLGLHVRTVRNYVREGRLKAVRIGKQYRIAAEDLAALTGRPVSAFEEEPVRRQRHVEVSSIVEIDAISREEVSRILNGLLAVGREQPDGSSRVHIETLYNEERARLKVIIAGGIADNAGLLRILNAYLES